MTKKRYCLPKSHHINDNIWYYHTGKAVEIYVGAKLANYPLSFKLNYDQIRHMAGLKPRPR